jgi:hypothetical protein
MAAGQTASPQDKARLDAMIEQGVASGYVQREGEFLLAKGAYEKGQVNLNGKPVATPLTSW